MNRIILTGNVTKDPTPYTSQEGITRSEFTLAVQRTYKNAQGVREADFIRVTAFRQTADFCNQYFKKGDKVGVEGALRIHSYDAQDGSKRYVTTVVADRVEIEHKAERKDEQPEAPRGGQQFTEVEDDGELPF